MPLEDSEIIFNNSKSYSPAIKIWLNGEVVLSADELTVELKNTILNIKGDVIEVKNKNKNKAL